MGEQRRAARRAARAQHGAHEGGVDALNMDEPKIASIIARMQGDLRLPDIAEGFDEVLCVVDDEQREDALARIWRLADAPRWQPDTSR